jgi:hypothetical protein
MERGELLHRVIAELSVMSDDDLARATELLHRARSVLVLHQLEGPDCR